MRKIVSLMHMSLDGFVADANGGLDWVNIDDKNFAFVESFIDQGDAGLYGPRTFQMMESHWPNVLRQPDAAGHQLHHAQWYSHSAHIVCSRSLKDLEDKEATLITGDIAIGLNDLKQRDGKNIILLGSPGLVQSLLALGLIDEFVITLNPVILGAGIPMFKNNSRTRLHLQTSTGLRDGVVGLHYKTE